MSRFKQVWLSFWRKDQGLGMIEAAITLPLFLIITFGVMEFGSMYMSRYQARDVANSVRDYLQGNPSASSADLQDFVINLGFGSLKNMGPNEDNNVFTKIKIQSGKTMKTAAQFDALCSGGDVKNWANPWLGGDPSDDQNNYYIHICYPYTYETITPLPGLTAGAIPETKTMNSKALAYISKEVSCPDGQVLQSMTGGSATCVDRDRDYSCPSGQMLTGISGGQPVCGAVPTSSGGCSKVPGTVLSDGTVVADACSNLVTTPADAPGNYTWSEAKNYCENLTANGKSDWVLPTIDELRTMSKNRFIIGGFDPTDHKEWYAYTYWSSTQTPSGNVWTVYMYYDYMYTHWTWQRLIVRCVRKSN